jgi:hypothetical protein
MTAHPPIQSNTIRVECDRGGPTSIPVADVFVALEPDANRAYMVHPCGGAALHWSEISLRSAELLVVLGAHAEVNVESAAPSRPQEIPSGNVPEAVRRPAGR